MVKIKHVWVCSSDRLRQALGTHMQPNNRTFHAVQKSAGVDVAAELEASEAERLKQVSCEHFEGLVIAPFAELWGVDIVSLTRVAL
jgi:hypothetical protein